MREESNLHAEATELQSAGRTTCPTHGWGDRRDLNPLPPGSRPGPATALDRSPCSRRESNPHPPDS